MSLRFATTRLGMLVVTVLVSSLAIYGAMFLTPGDPATLLVGGSRNPDPAVLAQIHREYHLDDPFIQGYWHWLSNCLQGDFGKSSSTATPSPDSSAPAPETPSRSSPTPPSSSSSAAPSSAPSPPCAADVRKPWPRP